MKRKMYNILAGWKQEDTGRTAMLIDGARRVGKSYIAEEFAKAEYRSYIIIDFNRVSQEVTDLFEHYLGDLDTFFLYLSNYYSVRLSSLKKDARFRDYEDALFWLSDAMIANMCYHSAAPNIGLKLNMNRMTLKCYMADTGLLISHAFDENGIVSEEIYKKLLYDKHSNSSRTDASSRMEIDFLIAKSRISSRHNISPIEVKSGKNYTLTSLRKFCQKFEEQVYTPFVLHTGDLKEEDGIAYLPLYMTPLL